MLDEHQASNRRADSTEVRDLDGPVPQKQGVSAKAVPIINRRQEGWLVDSIVAECHRWCGYGPEEDSRLPHANERDLETVVRDQESPANESEPPTVMPQWHQLWEKGVNVI
jgi:hypothetical protein